MTRSEIRFIVLIIALVSLVLMPRLLHAMPSGFTGRTLLTSSSGCSNCHGSSANSGVQATITGPSVVPPGQTASFTIRVTFGSGTSASAGVDIAVSSGTLSPVSSQLQLSGSEITHNTRLNRQTDYTFNYTAPASGSTVTIYATVAGDANSWNWASNVVVSLPVQLVSFAGVAINSQSVRLDWRTISEVNNYGFYVQRRAGTETEFADLPDSFVPGHGTTTVPQHYTFVDHTATVGLLAYRLRQVDLDGLVHYSDPIAVSGPTSVEEVVPNGFSLKQNYPNPFNPETTIDFSIEEPGRATLEIYDMLGQKVATPFDEFAETGKYYSVRFGGATLPSGTYLYRLSTEKRSEIKKLILLR